MSAIASAQLCPVPVTEPTPNIESHRCEACDFSSDFVEETTEMCRHCREQITAWRNFKRLINNMYAPSDAEPAFAG